MQFTFGEPEKTIPSVRFVEGDSTRVFGNEAGETTLDIGAGKMAEVDQRKLVTLIRKAVRVAREQKLKALAFKADSLRFEKTKDIADEELGRIFAENVVMANYEFTRYKSKKKDDYSGVETVMIYHNSSKEFEKGVTKGGTIGTSINWCRDLANTPGGDMTPSVLAKATEDGAKGTPASVTILGKREIEKLGMGLVLGVAQGSPEEPKFIVVEYSGGSKSVKPIVLIGKGVTFDSGGINIKTGDHMLGMHHDMAGGAAVITAVLTAAKLGLKKNVVALVPAVENMPSGGAIRPGDVLTSMSGKTVEVLNTDAEGRLILGDALTYAERYEPRLAIDVATLTGAALIALGTRASAILTRDQGVEDTLRALGEKSGDYVWPLPLWKEYDADVKGRVGDLANISTAANSRYGGTIVGGAFLAQFTGKYPWAHIDMAPRMESTPEDNLAKGSPGAPVRLLVRLIEEY